MKNGLRAIVGALLLVGIGSASAAGIPLSVELKAQATKASPGESVLWQVTNRGDEAVYVLRWETPLDGLSRSMFDVSINGKPVATAGDGTECGKVVAGAPGVFVNGKPIATAGDPTSCSK